MPSPKYTKIEITPEAYLALESETILQSKTLKRLASELILKGVSEESLDFAQRALAVGGTNRFDEKVIPKVIKDIGALAVKINETLLETAQDKLRKEGYLDTMLYVAQNTASMERDELHRILTICAYHKVPPSLAADILLKLKGIDPQLLANESSKDEKWASLPRPTGGRVHPSS
jgi:protein-L-isoaspartate O-methyltransferase